MKDNETKSKFVEMRAKNISFDKIAKELKVSKQTLITWSKDNELEINNLREIEFDSLRERLKLTKENRLTFLSKCLERINAELEKRDFANIPDSKLIELQIKLLNEVDFSTRFQMNTAFDFDMEVIKNVQA